jgi:hypothetical protein
MSGCTKVQMLESNLQSKWVLPFSAGPDAACTAVLIIRRLEQQWQVCGLGMPC